MQIDRSTRRWPYAVALTSLLVLCLTIPCYWLLSRSPPRTPQGADGRSSIDDVAYASARDYLVRRSRAPIAAGPAVTRPDDDRAIERALARLADPTVILPRTPPGDDVGDPDLLSDFFDEPKPSAPSPDPRAGTPAQPGPVASAALRYVGRQVASLSPHRWTLAATRRMIAVGHAPSAGTREPVAPRVRLSDPSERLALVPARGPRPTTVEESAATITPPSPDSTAPQISADAYPIPWSSPLTLIEEIEVLAEHPFSSRWAIETIDELRTASSGGAATHDTTAARLNRLNALAAEALTLADGTQDERLRAELLRAHWGLARRLECWKLMHQITVAAAGTNRFAARVPYDDGSNESAGQITEAVDLSTLSADLESYERSRAPRLARAITQRQRQLAASSDPSARALADQIDENYRNANVRVALSAELLRRFVQQPEPEFRPVHDVIAGTPVHGQSQTFAENRVRLQPATGYWQLGIQADGVVKSNTVADGGQAKLESHGTTQFSAYRSIVVASDGVHVGRSAIGTQNQNRLVGVHSSCDWVPVVGDVVRKMAVDQYWKKQPRAKAEVEYKVARQVEDAFDARTSDAIQQAEQQIRDRLTGPLAEAGIVLTPVELTTTSQRVVARLRLAGNEQLAGHTPRPRAPADSLASLQIHESALTNAALVLELNGRRQTAPELQQLLRDKIRRLQRQPAMEVEPDTLFHFAPRDAVRFRIADGRLEIILALAEVRFEGQTVRNFRVHAFYRPVIQGLEAELARDGALGIEGRLRTADRARMHGVFNKVLSEERRIPVIRLTEPVDARFDELMITQLVLEDGWLGLAVGPTYEGRTAERSRLLQ